MFRHCPEYTFTERLLLNNLLSSHMDYYIEDWIGDDKPVTKEEMEYALRRAVRELEDKIATAQDITQEDRDRARQKLASKLRSEGLSYKASDRIFSEVFEALISPNDS